jgi:hypothetical protein
MLANRNEGVWLQNIQAATSDGPTGPGHAGFHIISIENTFNSADRIRDSLVKDEFSDRYTENLVYSHSIFPREPAYRSTKPATYREVQNNHNTDTARTFQIGGELALMHNNFVGLLSSFYSRLDDKPC